jgi:hypothetical protein
MLIANLNLCCPSCSVGQPSRHHCALASIEMPPLQVLGDDERQRIGAVIGAERWLNAGRFAGTIPIAAVEDLATERPRPRENWGRGGRGLCSVVAERFRFRSLARRYIKTNCHIDFTPGGSSRNAHHAGAGGAGRRLIGRQLPPSTGRRSHGGF